MMDSRLGRVQWGPHAARTRTSAANWRKPLAWDRAAAAAGERHRVFCASLADVFDNAVDPAWRDDLWRLIEATPNLDWMLLTKRPGNIGNMLPVPFDFERLYPNVWLGCTVVNQVEADRDIPKLLAVPAAVRFLSMEPLLGPVSLTHMDVERHPAAKKLGALGGYRINALTGRNDDMCRPCPDVPSLDLVIVGGESGPGARPMHPDWARSLRDQCNAAGVAFLFKQWGEWKPVSDMTDAEADAMYLPAPEWKPLSARDSRFAQIVLTNGGNSLRPNDPDAWKGTGSMLMFRVGKSRSGRELDRQLHDGFIPAVETRERIPT